MPRVSKQRATTKRKPRAKKTGILDRIKPIGFDDSDGIKINVYGRSGTGKTTLWSTFPGPILAIICSGSNKSGEARSIDTPENRKKIKSVELESTTELNEIINHQKETEEFATIVLDHATDLQNLALKEILGLEELPAQLSWGLATQQQYGQCSLKMKEFLRALLNLSCNVVIVAQERDFNTDTESSDVMMPFVASALSPSVVGWLNPAVDYIAQTMIRGKEESYKKKLNGKTITKTRKVEGVEYCLRVAPDEVFTTKFRTPKSRKIEGVIVDPSYEKIMSIINGG